MYIYIKTQKRNHSYAGKYTRHEEDVRKQTREQKEHKMVIDYLAVLLTEEHHVLFLLCLHLFVSLSSTSKVDQRYEVWPSGNALSWQAEGPRFDCFDSTFS